MQALGDPSAMVGMTMEQDVIPTLLEESPDDDRAADLRHFVQIIFVRLIPLLRMCKPWEIPPLRSG